jgi:cell division protein FtsL
MGAVATRTNSNGLLRSQDIRVRRDLRDFEFLYRVALAAVMVVAVVFLFLWCRLTVIDMGYEISNLNKTGAVEREQNKRLRLELTRLKSPERIEAVAKGKLGLIYPSVNQIIRVRP